MTQKLKEQGHGIGWEMSGGAMGLRQMGQSESMSVMVDAIIQCSTMWLSNCHGYNMLIEAR